MKSKLKIFTIVLLSVFVAIVLVHFVPYDFRNYEKELNDAERELINTIDAKQRFYALTRATEAAAQTGHFEEAKIYAEELLQLSSSFRENWNYGNAIHYSHVALGKVALSVGDIESAKVHLLEAGRTIGSPQLNAAGPDTSLARDLLKRKERDVVINYFEQCKEFWKSGKSRLDLWIWEIKLGLLPGFHRF